MPALYSGRRVNAFEFLMGLQDLLKATLIARLVGMAITHGLDVYQVVKGWHWFPW